MADSIQTNPMPERKNFYALMLALQAEEEQRFYGPSATAADRKVAEAYEGYEMSYDTVGSREQLLTRLKTRHGVGRDR